MWTKLDKEGNAGGEASEKDSYTVEA